MALCLIASGKATAWALTAFTLSWTHSVEKVRWEEDWRVTAAGLELVAARIRGSAAGMEVPDGAVLQDGVWHYAPTLPVQKALVLARSGATGAGWSLCSSAGCIEIGRRSAAPVELRSCDMVPVPFSGADRQ